MSKWIYFASIILFYYAKNTLESNHTLQTILGTNNVTDPVWINDNIIIAVIGSVVSKWSFNKFILAEYDFDLEQYTYFSNTPLSNNIAVTAQGRNVFLNLENVTRNYTGIYEADGETDIYILNMMVCGNNL
jgi:hypothetical protein